MEKIALPYYKGGKRMMFAGCNNFGEGSFDSTRRMHKFALSGPSIIPVTLTRVTHEEQGKPNLLGNVTYNAIETIIWEN